MAVIVDTVLLFQLLNVFERSFGMWAGNAITQRLAGVQEDFFQTAIQAHSFMLGKITEQSSQALLQSDRDIHTLNLERRPGAKETMAEAEMVTVQIPHRIVA